ncbi:MAG: class I SAM-dependent methyltransferase [Methylomicrobium sp.]|nr:class I SAM-dependent methyltransferase [Methylomicrobium sp.]
MKRIHFFEIEDQAWCPRVLRDGVTDFLQHIVRVYRLYRPVAGRLTAAISQSGHERVVDLCSGGAGPWLSLYDDVYQQSGGTSLSVLLTDLYPNLPAFQAAHDSKPEVIRFREKPVDATQVPEKLKGFRTLFSSFHHLNPEQAQAVLQNAVDAKTGIAIFESTQRHPLLLLYMLITPLLVWLNTPFMRPFHWSRLFWTYVIPVIPLIVMFDGIVSCLRTYTPEELQSMVAALDAPGYQWDIGLQRIAGLPVGVTYLIGYPK